MADTSGNGSLFNPFSWMGPYGSLAVGGLTQPILPGWHIGDTTIVNEGNSSSPATERKILTQASYGRQIGRLMDAVCQLIQNDGGPKGVPAFEALIELRDKIEKIKAKSVTEHVAQLRQDLEHLKTHDKAAYERTVEALRELLPRT